MAKLTLNVDAEIIEQAKRLAAENHTSVSAMFARFIRLLANGGGSDMSIGKIAKKASGMIGRKTLLALEERVCPYGYTTNENNASRRQHKRINEEGACTNIGG